MSDSSRKISEINTRSKSAPDGEVEDFKPDNFTPITEAPAIADHEQPFDADAPAQGPLPDPFEEFEVDRKPLSQLYDDLPSLSGLFRPFDLNSPTPQSEGQGYEDLSPAKDVSEFIYEDMDLRDPDVIRTLSQAQDRAAEMTLNAQQEAARIIEKASIEAKALEGSAEKQAERTLAEAKEKAETLRQSAAEALAEAEQLRRQAQDDRTEADAQLSSAADRIAGLDSERAQLESDFDARKKELEEQHAAQAAEFQAGIDQAREEGQKSGYQDGLQKGIDEGREQGRAEFQANIDQLITIIKKVSDLYDELWAANGPMMIQLAIEAAGQILNKELSEAKDLTVRAFMACIDYLSQANKVTFFANPKDISLLEEARAEQREKLGALVKVSFKPDDTLGPGDLIMESDVGRLDATVKHRRNEVLTVLKHAFESSFHEASPPAANIEANGANDENLQESPDIPEIEDIPAAEPDENLEALEQND